MPEYVKTCTFCKQEIQMSDKDGKWLPYNKDGSAHDCRTKQDTSTREQRIEAVIKKVQSVITDLEGLKQ